MLQLEAGECDCPAHSWVWVTNTAASRQVIPELESLHDSWVLLIEVLENHKSLEIVIGTLDRLKKNIGTLDGRCGLIVIGFTNESEQPLGCGSAYSWVWV